MILLTFEPDHHNLFKSRAEAEQIAAYYPGAKYTIRDLDQEAKDREEMIGLLERYVDADTLEEVDAVDPSAIPLLKRLGRLP